MNNNDILKNHIRSNKGESETYSSISGVALANANRTQLDEWIADNGEDSETIIAMHRAMEGPDAPSPRPAKQSTISIGAAIEAAIAAAAGQSIDVEELKADVLAHVQANISAPLRVETIRPDGTEKTTGSVHEQFPLLLKVAAARCHAFLVGPAGSFKTSAASQVAEQLELPFSSISVCSQTTASALLGFVNAMGETVRTEFRERFEKGGIFLLDEIDNGNANVLAVLNSALANGHCAFPDGMIKKHDDFILIAAGNTTGHGATAQFVGRCQIDGATLDRFINIKWHYDEKLESEITGESKWRERVISLRHAAAAIGSRAIISPRATFDGIKLLAQGIDEQTVEEITIWNKGISEIEKTKILETIKAS